MNTIPGSDSPAELAHLLRDPRRFFHTRFERHGRVFRTRFVFPLVFAIGEEHNRTIMITSRASFSMGRGYQATAVDQVFHGSIMLQDGAEHDRTRAILSPAVGRLAVRATSERTAHIWRRHIERLRPGRPRRPANDCYDVAERATFDVAANALTGLELGSETDAFRPGFELLNRGITAATKLRIPMGRLDRALKARVALRAMMRPRVERARSGPPEGLVGQLAQFRDDDGHPLDTDAIIDHLFLLVWAGYDTTASMASWALEVLAARPDWQTRLRDELAATIGDDVGAIEGSRDLPQLDWFLLEIERMFPSALFFPRIALEDFDLGGYTVRAGTCVCYSPYMSHRDPLTFEHPNAFDPDRWSPERGERRAHKRALFGFGGGPRLCLGKAFAKMQLKVMIDELLRRHELQPDPLSRPRITGIPVHHPVNSHFLVS